MRIKKNINSNTSFDNSCLTCDATGYHSPLCEAIGEPTALCSCTTVYHQPTEIETKFT